ncbi:MAG: DUF2309 family protein, partial [Bradyrhizobium sp.]
MTALARAALDDIDQTQDANPDADLIASINAACKRIAPLWPLKHFVAVNPFLGFTDQSFAATCSAFNRIARTRMLMPRSFYRDAIAQGLIDDDALQAAL